MQRLICYNLFLFSVQNQLGALYSKSYMNHVDNEGTSALHLAVQNGQTAVSNFEMVALTEISTLTL